MIGRYKQKIKKEKEEKDRKLKMEKLKAERRRKLKIIPIDPVVLNTADTVSFYPFAQTDHPSPLPRGFSPNATRSLPYVR